jgi:enterobacteria phage integrase
MPRRKLQPFVEVWRDRHGKLRVYFRKDRGPRIALPVSIGSPEFEQAYRSALVGGPLPDMDSADRRAAPGTIESLIRSYIASTEFKTLRVTTKSGYSFQMESLRREHGHRTVAGLDRERIGKLVAPFANKPGAALARLKMLRVLIRHAILLGWLQHDPSLGIKRPKGGEVRSWTEAEIAQFEAHWLVGTKERLGFALMLFTGQRRSDVHRMTWADVTGDSIKVVQQKTGAKLMIPLHAELRAIVSQTKREHVAILFNGRGKAFTAPGFSVWMRKAITAAGLPIECQPHGLRKAAGRRLAEAGCSSRELMAVLGHKTLAEAERYTRDADQVRLATAAVARLQCRR